MKKKSSLKTYEGEVICPNCKTIRLIKTANKDVLTNSPLCFECHMNSYAKIAPKKRKIYRYSDED